MFKKGLAIILSFAMVLSVASGTFSAFAYSGDSATGSLSTTNVVTLTGTSNAVSQSDNSVLNYTPKSINSTSAKVLMGLDDSIPNLMPNADFTVGGYCTEDERFTTIHAKNASKLAEMRDDSC